MFPEVWVRGLTLNWILGHFPGAALQLPCWRPDSSCSSVTTACVFCGQNPVEVTESVEMWLSLRLPCWLWGKTLQASLGLSHVCNLEGMVEATSLDYRNENCFSNLPFLPLEGLSQDAEVPATSRNNGHGAWLSVSKLSYWAGEEVNRLGAHSFSRSHPLSPPHYPGLQHSGFVSWNSYQNRYQGHDFVGSPLSSKTQKNQLDNCKTSIDQSEYSHFRNMDSYLTEKTGEW